ncbi:MAG: hypothetical protein AAB407_02635 [Patescibacteria group bacterium]
MTAKLSRNTVFIALGLIGALAFAFPVSATSAPDVTTFSAENVTKTSATFSGHETQSSTGNVITWFEYGTSPSLTPSNSFSTGHNITSYPKSLSTDFSASVSSLTAGTTYYVRAVSKNTFGIGYGAIVSFTTTDNPPTGSLPTVITKPATNVSQTSATLNASVNPEGKNTDVWFEWGTSQSLGNATNQQSAGSGSSFVNVSKSINNLSPNTTYYFRAVGASNVGASEGTILSFTTQGGGQSGSAPNITTLSAYSIEQTSATLQGSANPNGNSTNAWFEYGTSQSLGNTVGNQNVGSGNGSVNYSFSIQNLSPNTTYYFRAVGSNSYGTTQGSILSFTTQANQSSGSAPSATTNSASGVGQNSALLNGTVNPNGGFTDVRFEWGTSFSLGNTVGSQTVGNGNGNVNVSASLFNLSQNTTYYFRVVAQNSSGTTFGSILSFTTQGGNTGGGGGSGSPFVNTIFSSNISANSATLHGSVNPNSAFTSGWFEYGTSQFLGNSTASMGIGSGNSSLNFSSTIQNLAPNTTYYFRAVGQNTFSTSYGSILSFTTSGSGGSQGNFPTVSTLNATSINQTSATLQGFANPNGSQMNAWFEYGTSQSLGNTTNQQFIGSGFGGSTYFTSLFNLSQNTTYYFRAVAQNSFGTVYGSVLSFNTSSGFNGSGNIPFVSTNGASLVETISAQLNSTVDPRGSQTTARFEWGTTPSLGNSTVSRDIGFGQGSIPFSWFLPSLSPNTTYYYRVTATNNFGTSYGTITSFKTRSVFVPPQPTTPPKPSTPVSQISPSIVLSPTADNNNPAPGETIIYTLNYWNDSDRHAVSRLMLRITLSDGLEFISSSNSVASESNNVVTFNLGNLNPLDQNSVRLTLRVRDNMETGDTLTAGAVMNYRDANNQDQSTSAYRTFTVSGSGFLASIFGLSIPFGWILLIILLILIIFFIAREFSTKRVYYKN